MRGVRLAAATLVGAATVVGCSESLQTPPPVSGRAMPVAAVVDACGASFTAVTLDQDSLLMARFGGPPTVDTVTVCETWTGSDYVVTTKVLGSSEMSRGVRDTLRQLTYQSGGITGFDSTGLGITDGPVNVSNGATQPTVFSLVGADSATQAASYDAPYYAIYAPAEGTETYYSLAPAASVRMAGSVAVTVDTTKRYTRHGLSRRGVRALVEDADEIDRGPDGSRRFRKRKGPEETVYLVDPVTELLLGEDSDTPSGRAATRHYWKTVANGFVRDRTETVSVDVIDGRTYRGRLITIYSDVRIAGIAP